MYDLHRSPHPYLAKYEEMPDKRYGEQKLFWDGFQWVSKTNPIVKNFEQSTNTKKVQISGLPLELGLRADDLKKELNAKLKEKYHNDKDIILKVDLIVTQNAVAVELSTREDIAKIKETFDGQNMLGQSLRVTSFEDKTINFNVSSNSNASSSMFNPIANSAQTAAQAAAIATAALKGMQGQEVKITLQGQSTERCMAFASIIIHLATRILKVWNVVDPIDMNQHGTDLQEIQMDMKEAFRPHGNLIDIRMVMPGKEQLGADVGSIFVEYEDEKSAERATEELKERRYDTKLLHLAYVKPELYESQFKAISEPFISLELPPEAPAAANAPAEGADQSKTDVQQEIIKEIAPQTQPTKEADYEFE